MGEGKVERDNHPYHQINLQVQALDLGEDNGQLITNNLRVTVTPADKPAHIADENLGPNGEM